MTTVSPGITGTASVYGSLTAANVVATLDLGSRPALRQREIQRALGGKVTINMVQQALSQLLKRGVIKVTRSGDIDVYEVDRSSPRYPGVHRIALVDLAIAERLRALSDDIMAVLVYGSVVDGKARPDSDLDILIIGMADEIDVERTLSPLKLQLGRRIDVSMLDYFQFKSRRAKGDAFLTKALSQGVVVMGRIPE